MAAASHTALRMKSRPSSQNGRTTSATCPWSDGDLEWKSVVKRAYLVIFDVHLQVFEAIGIKVIGKHTAAFLALR